jgi:hypothetical protein
MKTRTYKLILLAAFVILATSIKALEVNDEFSKTLQKDFQINSKSELEITNKYGSVHIQNWDQNTFNISVKITVDVKDKKQADDLLNMLTVVFSQEGDKISAITKISEDFGRSGNWFGSNKKFSIDYTVKMPKNNSLKVSNKYGNIFIDERSGYVDIDLKYGDMNINKLTRGDEKPMNQIILAYGKASIVECNWLKLQISYSKIDLERSKALVLLSKYSKGDLGKISSLVSDNSYDTYQIGDLSNLVVVGKYSNFQINSVFKKADVNVKYTDIKVNLVPRTFESISINSQYGRVAMGIENGASYKLDGFAKYTDIEYPRDNARVSRISENTKLTVNGTIGNDPKATVKVNTEYGGVKLIQ